MTEPEQPTGTPKKFRWLPAVVISTLVVGALVMLDLGADDDPGFYDRMVTLCQQVARDRALAPTSVQFVDDVELHEIVEPQSWTVLGSMDGQNMFGAMLRSRYECSLTYDREADQFSATLMR